MYIALYVTLSIDCYRVGAVPKVYGLSSHHASASRAASKCNFAWAALKRKRRAHSTKPVEINFHATRDLQWRFKRFLSACLPGEIVCKPIGHHDMIAPHTS